ncbi:MAG: ASPIC/UnbV domain-containing protein, partial [Myxococcota bacterium]|nr:ASPIC/UnbV domain-containing protein [Myxococcota bacterium]
SNNKNTRGIGARIDVVAEDGQTWTRWILAGDSFASSGPPRAHFGLGTNTDIARIDVYWPNGNHTKENRPQINTRLTIQR